MNRRSLLLAPVALALTGLPARAAPIPLATLSRYLDALTTLEAPFTQINPDGTIATGTILISRPGRVRFEYAPPDRTLVLADGQQVAIFDPKSNQPPEQYPLRRTPLNLILAPRVDLTQARMVLAHREEGATTRVVAQDPEFPEYGQIELVFTSDPVELRQWVVTDDSGATTTLILGDAVKGRPISGARFDISATVRERQGRIDR
jgi:outer membrane lipoprotein-sorting protein